MENLIPKKYAIAKCSVNVWGVILSDEPKLLTFADGTSSTCWTGLACRQTDVVGWGILEGQIVTKKVGEPWASKKPRVIAHLNNVENLTVDELLELADMVIDQMEGTLGE